MPFIMHIICIKNIKIVLDNARLIHYNKRVRRVSGMAKPKQNTQRLVVYITPELEKSLQEEAEKKGTNVSNLVRMILTEREETKSQ